MTDTPNSARRSALAWIDGRILPATEASIPLLDHGLLYGDGVFEGLRFYGRRVFRLAAHLERLRDSARALCLPVPMDDAAMTTMLDALIAASGLEDGYVRLVVTRGVGELGLAPASCGPQRVFAIAGPIALVPPEVRRAGLDLVTSANVALPPNGLDGRIKSLNYLARILARLDADAAGAHEAVMLNAAGHVAEGTADNLFIVRGNRLSTPPTSDGALAGITREVVLACAAELGLDVQERHLSRYDLWTADACLLSGTGAELLPVRRIDGRALPECPGPTFDALERAFRDRIRRECVAA